MTGGAKVFRSTDVAENNASGYPEPFREAQRKRYNRRLGDHAGLKTMASIAFGCCPAANPPPATPHSKDEFVYVLEGELVLVRDAGRQSVGPGA
jgi:uncharacterized cupin superfamily protein